MDKIKDIAKATRIWAEDYAHTHNMAADLCGMCAIASAELFTNLIFAGFKPEIRISNSFSGNHVYCVVDDHVVDVTATQFHPFEEETVVILHECEAAAYNFYVDDIHYIESIKALVKYQKKYDWPKKQRVSIA
jgi:anti-sigma regulatory factor (Ser/Thr protein kinase)